MIDIFFKYHERGPGKVIDNLIKGLNKINIQYMKNPSVVKESDKKIFLQNHNLMSTSIIENSIVGPNICTLPIDNKIVMEQKYKKIIVPSEWVKNKYKKWIQEDKIEVWPVGVDTELFSDISNEEKEIDCLLYFKRRGEGELNLAKELLEKMNLSFKVIKYGEYNESEFIQTIRKSKFSFVIDNCESRGLAIEEMMSCNLPLFVWDVEFWNDRGEEHKVEATSVPYWSNKCGEKTISQNQLEGQLKKFLENINSYNPREYILNNLSLKKQAEELIKILEE
jgi:hypothetical protein